MAEVCDLVEDFASVANARQEKTAGFLSELSRIGDANGAAIIALLSSVAILSTANIERFASIVVEQITATNATISPVEVSESILDRATLSNVLPFSIADRRADSASLSSSTSFKVSANFSEQSTISDSMQQIAEAITLLVNEASLLAESLRFMTDRVADSASATNQLLARLPEKLIADTALISNALSAFASAENEEQSSMSVTAATQSQVDAAQSIVERAFADTEMFSASGGAWTALAQTWAMSRYTNMPFNSIAVADGRTLMFSESGIFEASGDLDGSDPVAARMDAGIADFGTDRLKRPRYAYAGHTGGPLAIEVKGSSPPETYTYPFELRSAEFNVQSRVSLGRGLRARYYQIAILNQAGARFSLDDVRIITDETSRRV